MNLKRAYLNFVLSYLVVTVLCYGLTFLVTLMLKLPTAEELGVGIFQDPAFVMTVPWHILINLLTWTAFGRRYLRKEASAEAGLKPALQLGALWLATALAIDVVIFVAIKSPFSMKAREFYVDYQPWITLTYLTVIGGPILAYLGRNLWNARARAS